MQTMRPVTPDVMGHKPQGGGLEERVPLLVVAGGVALLPCGQTNSHPISATAVQDAGFDPLPRIVLRTEDGD